MADRYFVGAVDNDWHDAGNWSASSGGAGGAGIPTAADKAIFDGSSPNCTVDANIDTGGIEIQNTYANTLDINDFDAIIRSAHGFSIAGGTIMLGIGTITSQGNWSFTGGTITPENSTVKFFGNSSPTISGSHTLYSVTFDNALTASRAISISLGTTLTVTGQLIFQTGNAGAGHLQINTGTVRAEANIEQSASGGTGIVSGSASLLIAGTANQTFDGFFNFPNEFLPVTINKTGGTLSIENTVRTGSDWTYTAGTIDGFGRVRFEDTLTISGSHTLPGAYFDNPSSASGKVITINAGDTLTVSGKTFFEVSNTGNRELDIQDGTIAAQGDIDILGPGGTGFIEGDATLLINGAGDQAFFGDTSFYSILPFINVEINKPSGTLTLSGTITTSSDWTYTSGTIDGTAEVRFQLISAFTISGSHTLYDVLFDVPGTSPVSQITIAAGTVLSVSNLLTFDVTNTGDRDLTIDTGTIAAQGDILIEAPGSNGAVIQGSGSLLINGVGNQQFQSNLTEGVINHNYPFLDTEIDKASGDLELVGTIFSGNGWTYTQGNITGTGKVRFVLTAGSFAISGSHTLPNVTFDNPSGAPAGSITIAAGTTLSVSDELIFDITNIGGRDIQLDTGILRALGDVYVDPPGSGGNIVFGSATLEFGGTSQTWDCSGKTDQLQIDVIIGTASSTPTVTMASDVNLAGAGIDLTILNGSGTLDLNDQDLTVNDMLQVGNIIRMIGTETVTYTTLTWGSPSSCVYYDDTLVATISNFSNNFTNLTNDVTLVLGDDKDHDFSATVLYTVDIIDSNGTNVTPSVLRSTIPTTQWQLDLNIASNLTNNVDVQDSDATPGIEVEAYGSVDSGNNLNWKFTCPSGTGMGFGWHLRG